MISFILLQSYTLFIKYIAEKRKKYMVATARSRCLSFHKTY